VLDRHVRILYEFMFFIFTSLSAASTAASPVASAVASAATAAEAITFFSAALPIVNTYSVAVKCAACVVAAVADAAAATDAAETADAAVAAMLQLQLQHI
jgi:hypothetical protein